MRYNCLKQLLFRGSSLAMMVLLASSIIFAKDAGTVEKARKLDQTLRYRYVLIVPEVANVLSEAVKKECCGCPEVERVVYDLNRGMRSCTWDDMMCALDVALKRVDGKKKIVLKCYRDELERQAKDGVAAKLPVVKRSFACNPATGCSGAIPPNFSNDIGILTGVRDTVCTGPCQIGEPCARPNCPRPSCLPNICLIPSCPPSMCPQPICPSPVCLRPVCPSGPPFPCQPPFNITACANAIQMGELFCSLASEGLFIECDDLYQVGLSGCTGNPFSVLPVDILCDVCQPAATPQAPTAPVIPNITGGGKVLLCDVEVLSIIGNTAVFGELGIEEDINVLGNGIFGGDLDVDGNVRIGGSLDVGTGIVGGGALQIGGDGTFDGNVCIGDGLRVNNGLCTNGDALINGNLLVDENIVANGNITVGGRICALSGLCASGPICANDIIADRIRARIGCIDEIRFEDAVGNTACIDFIAADTIISDLICVDDLVFDQGQGSDLVVGNATVTGSACITDAQVRNALIHTACVRNLQAEQLQAGMACVNDLQVEQLQAGQACVNDLQVETFRAATACALDLQAQSLLAQDACVSNLRSEFFTTATGAVCFELSAGSLRVPGSGCIADLQAVQFLAGTACISDLDTVYLRSATACIVGLQSESLQARNACVNNGNINILNSQVACLGDAYADRIGAPTAVFDSVDVCQMLIQDLFIDNIVQYNGLLTGLCWPQAFGELVFTAGDFCKPLCSILPASETGCYSVVEGFVYLPYNFTGCASQEVVCGAQIPECTPDVIVPGRLPHVDFLVPADYNGDFELDVCAFFPDNPNGSYRLRVQVAHVSTTQCVPIVLPQVSFSLEVDCGEQVIPEGSVVRFRLDDEGNGVDLSPGDWIRIALDFSDRPAIQGNECLPMVNSMVFRYSRVDINEAGAIFPG